jgi:hypothetical protein
MPSTKRIKEINEGLRSGLSSSIKLAKATSTAEDVALLQEDLNGYADEIGTFINLHIPLDQDVIIAYAELRRLAAELNEDNRADNDGRDILTIPLPYTVHPDTHAVTTFPFPELPLATATGSGYHNANNTNHVPYGEGNHGQGHGDYHAMGEHQPLVGVTHEDNGCCGGCVMM